MSSLLLGLSRQISRACKFQDDDVVLYYDFAVELFDRLETLERVAEATKAYLPYVPSGDLLGANKYLDQQQKARVYRDALAALEEK